MVTQPDCWHRKLPSAYSRQVFQPSIRGCHGAGPSSANCWHAIISSQEEPRRSRWLADEWLLSDLVRALEMHPHHLRNWMARKQVHWRRSPVRRYYIIWADADELKRLRKLKAYYHAHPSMNSALYPKELTTPKPRKSQGKKAKTPAQD